MKPEWSIQTLKEYVDTKIEAVENKTSASLAGHERLDFARHESSERAVIKAEEHALRQLAAVSSRLDAMEARYSETFVRIHSRLDIAEGRSRGLTAGWAILIGVFGLIGTAIGVVSTIVAIT